MGLAATCEHVGTAKGSGENEDLTIRLKPKPDHTDSEARPKPYIPASLPPA